MEALKGFIKDQWVDVLGYLGITFLLIFFYRLTLGDQVEIIYPMVLAFFIGCMIFVMKGYRYFGSLKGLESAIQRSHQKSGWTYLDKQTRLKIEGLHKEYLERAYQLEKTQDEKDAMITQMVHDLKIPMSVIRLILDDPAMGQENFPMLQEKIKGEGEKVISKLEQLLCFLRMSKFEKDYVLEPVNLVQEVRNAINGKKELFIYHKVFPKMIIEGEAYPVLTDKKWNGVLLDQILSNAIKYSAVKGEGTVEFTITTEGKWTYLLITDYGIGIPEYDLDRIYDPFFTGENGRKVGNASGIGLYICKNIATLLNHSLEITSVPGEMTQVRISYLSKL